MKNVFLCFLYLLPILLLGQIPNGVYIHQKGESGVQVEVQRLMLADGYAVLTSYQQQPDKFLATKGGKATITSSALEITLDFSTTYEKDQIKALAFPYEFNDDKLIINGNRTFIKQPTSPQALDGRWLMAGRVTDQGEKRKNIDQPRKTLKFLLDGYFQWVAFTQGSFEFYGSGGGSYTAIDGKYIEKIAFFSRDNSRVGMGLDFQYERKGNDWYHSGLSSKGKPLHEIWSMWLP